MSKQLKYQIDFLLKKFPYEDHSKLIKIIPPLLHIKESTFFKWKATDLKDPFEIPEGRFEMLCHMFEVKPEEMRCYDIKTPLLKDLLEKNK